MPSGWEKHPNYGSTSGWGSTALATVAVIAMAFGIAYCSSRASAQQGDQIVGVASVIDGDTIEIHGTNIRLWGFDAPERGRRCAGNINAKQMTSNALSDFIGQRTVSCEARGYDGRWDRPVAMCSVGGTEIGVWMVEQGYARDWPHYSGRYYAAIEQRARALRRGLWGMECPGLWGSRNHSP